MVACGCISQGSSAHAGRPSVGGLFGSVSCHGQRRMVMLKKCLMFSALLVSLVPRPSEGRVVRFVVEQKRVFAGGNAFGAVGPYERLDGTAYFEVDPTDPLNAIIVNISKAPKNAKGMVEFSAPFFILKPVDIAK